MDNLKEFHSLVSDEWEFRLQFDPIFATMTGDNRYNDQLAHVTPQDWERHRKVYQGFHERLTGIDPSKLRDVEQLNYDIFRRIIEDQILEDDFGAYYLPIAKTAGFHLEFPELFQYVPLNTQKDYENYISRIEAFSRFVQDNIVLMREGVQKGYRPVRAALDGIDASLASQIVDSPQASPLFQPFTHFPASFSPVDQERLIEDGGTAIMSSVVPGFLELRRYIEEEYLPIARDEVGASNLPGGLPFYTHRIHVFTSLDLSAEEVHATGQSEVKRIRAEMKSLIAETGFSGDLKSFIEFLRTDKRFYVQTGEALMAHTALILKRMDGELPRLFKTLPRMPYGIRPIPDYSAPGNTTAYYFPPAGDGTRSGTYYVNLYDLPSRPLYEYEALSLHEAVPGHHLQIALQQELGELPNFRRFGGFTAFVEGWALYAERLGLEVGFYQDAYSNFSRLSYEMWRACRLVVDTGMHALGWTRQQAIDFMAANTSLTLLNITNEVDRYIFWPGQALAYKIGELKIRELRARAEENLGSRFDLREFHDLVLGSGAVPLDILEKMVDQWIHQTLAV